MIFLNFLLAMLPIFWLIIALSVLKIPGHIACAITLVLTGIIAAIFWKMEPLAEVSAVAEGTLNALWPICLVVVAALFAYQLTVSTGAMDTIKRILGGVSKDRRILALLIAWGFGNFMEGIAGFGTAVAIPASILAGIGLNPAGAVISCLVANSIPTCFGSVGIPVQTLASVTGVSPILLSGNAAIMQALISLITPFFVVIISGGGLKAMKGMWRITLLASLGFVIPWFATAEILGPELPNIIASLCSMALIIFLSHMFNKNVPEEYRIQVQRKSTDKHLTVKDIFIAWCPFILIFVFLVGTSDLIKPVHTFLAQFKSQLVVYSGEGGNTLTFSWLNTPGVIIFIAAIIGGFIQGARVKQMVRVLLHVFKQYWKTIVTICLVMATSKVMGYSGMISDIANFFVTVTGRFYPLIAPVIGAVGGFVTGSGTSTCVLFGQLQSQTGEMLGFAPAWLASANVVGAGIGKMICPQSIAIGTGAVGMGGHENKMMNGVMKYFIIYLLLACAFSMAGSFIM